MNSSRRSASTALGAVALLAVAGAATARVCFDVVATDMVYFLVRASETPRLVPLAGFVALFELLLLRVKPRRLLEVFAPFVLVLPFLPFPPSVNLLAAYAAAAGLTVYRAALVGAFDGKSARQFTGRLPLLSGLLTVLMCALGVLASKLAYDRLFLTMSDWGIYTAMAWNTFHGEILRGTWPVPDFSAGHFMPGFFFPMSVVFGLLPSVFTAFGCGALALWGSAVLVWLFARKRGFSRPYAAAFGLIWLLYPSVSNLNYTLFYGVNAIVSFIPVFFGFYLLYEAKRYKLAFLVFLFSLTLKETVGIFWLGWGIVSFFEGRRRDGVLYGAIGALYFLLAVKVLIPYFAGADYIFYGQFEQLGGGMTDILLSPFTRPGEFWGQVLRIKNLQLLVLLLLPVFPGALNRPWLLGASALLLGFNFVRGSEEIVNLVLQYQVETIAMFTVALVLGVRQAKASGRLPRLLAWRLEGAKKQNTRLAMTAGTLGCAFFSHVFFAETFYGKNNVGKIDGFTNAQEEISELKKIIPPGVKISAGQQLAPQFLFRNTLYGEQRPEGEFVLYHIGDDPISVSLEQHRKNLEDPALTPVWSRRLDDGRTLLLFRRGADLPRLRPYGTVRPARSVLPPRPAATEDGIRCFTATFLPGENGGVLVRLKLLRKLDAFPRIYAQALFPDGRVFRKSFFFADAAVAPEQLPVGATDEFTIPVSPEELANSEFGIGVRLLP